MAGCFGGSQYDRDMERRLYRYLDEQDDEAPDEAEAVESDEDARADAIIEARGLSDDDRSPSGVQWKY